MFRALSLYKEKLDKRSRVEQFMLMLNLFEGASYKMGKENLEQTDCSGVVCGALTLLGNEIRVNANDLYNIFSVPDNKIYDELKVKLIFFLDGSGIAKHVGVLAPNSLVFHASYPNGARYESLTSVIGRYNKLYNLEVRMLSFGKVDKNTGLVYGLDEELS